MKKIVFLIFIFTGVIIYSLLADINTNTDSFTINTEREIDAINAKAHPVLGNRIENIKLESKHEERDIKDTKANSSVYGLNLGLPLSFTSSNTKIYGIDLSLLFTNSIADGMQIAPANIANDSNGAQIGLVTNMAKKSNALQISPVNIINNSTGFQIGAVNYSKSSKCIQFGLINYMDNGFLPIFPIINFSI